MTTLVLMEEVVSAEVTSSVTVSSTNVAAQTSIIALPSFTYRAVPYLFEFKFASLTPGSIATALILTLFEGTTNVGRIYQQNAWFNNVLHYGGTYCYRLVPTAGARVFSVQGWRVGGANATISAGPARTADGIQPIQFSAYQVL